jgi:DDE family transposase
VPLPDWEHQRPFYGPAQFIDDVERDGYLCPQGALLRPFRRSFQQERVQYRAAAATCNACPVKAACTPSNAGRVVDRSFHAEYLDRVRSHHETEAYGKAMRKRKVWIEPLFGEAKQWHGMRQFRLRGLAKVNIEGLFIAAGQNLKRLLSATGWGRRPWPDGVAGFAGLTHQNCLVMG